LLIQHHQPHAGDGLAHRIDAKDAVVLHGPGAFELQIPLRFKIGDLPLTGYERESASDFASINVALHMGANALQALGRESDFFWFYEHSTSCGINMSPVWCANARSQGDLIPVRPNRILAQAPWVRYSGYSLVPAGTMLCFVRGYA